MPTIRLVIEMNAVSEAQAITEINDMVQNSSNKKSIQVISTETRIS